MGTIFFKTHIIFTFLKLYTVLFTAKARTGSSRKPDFWEILEFSINLLKSRINQNRIKKVRGGRDSNPSSMVP